jgi:mannonate dehydratase
MKRLLEGAPSPYNGICYCTGNVWHVEGEGMYDVIRRLGEKIFFVHIRNVKTGQGEKEYWFDKGDVDMLKVIQALKDINYRGDVRSEHLPTDLYRNAPQPPGISDIGTAFAVGYMRALLKTIP